MPRSHSAAMPPVSASGTALNTSSASRAEPSAPNSSRKIRTKHAGTTIASRCRADGEVLELPAPVEPVARRRASPARRSSPALPSTNEPMSRPRTLAVTTTRRLPFSRLIWFGPSVCVERRRSPRSGIGRPRRPSAVEPRQRHRQIFEGRDVIAQRVRQPDHDLEAPVALEHQPGLAPADRGADQRPARPRGSGRGARSPPCRCLISGTAARRSARPSRLPRRRCFAGHRRSGSRPAASGSKSSPNTLTATSSRTPAISSLNRIWIGWGTRSCCPAASATAASIRSISSSLVMTGSGHCVLRLEDDERVGRRSAASGRPRLRRAGLEKTNATSGNLLNRPLDCELHRLRLREAVLGMRMHLASRCSSRRASARTPARAR